MLFTVCIIFSNQKTFSFVTSVNAAVYYVANNGNDSNAGKSQDVPWKTIAKINSSNFAPGDSILFNQGDLWREELVVPSSGSVAAPLHISSYGTGTPPVITGADLTSGWSGPDSNGEYSITGPSSTRIFLMNGKRIVKKTVGSLVAESWGYASGKLYFKPVLGRRAADYSLESGTRNHCLVIKDKQYMTIDSLTFIGGNGRDLDTESACTVKITGASAYITLQNCVVKEGLFTGIGLESGPSFIVINNCDIYGHAGVGIDIRGIETKNITITNNKIHDIAGLPSDTLAGGDKGGITITSHHGEDSNCVIEGNDIYDNSYGSETARCDYGISIYEASGNTVRNNKIYNNYGGGIYVIAIADNARNNRIHYNLLWDNGKSVYPEQNKMAIRLGGSLGYDISGAEIYNNVIFNNNLKTGVGALHVGGNSGNVKIFNNILFENDTKGFELFFSATNNFLQIGNNCYYRPEGNVVYFSGKTYNSGDMIGETGSVYSKSVPNDIGFIFGDPLFVDKPNFNLQLRKGSPCIDKGKTVGLEKDFLGTPLPMGNAVDIGCFEFQPKMLPPKSLRIYQ